MAFESEPAQLVSLRSQRLISLAAPATALLLPVAWVLGSVVPGMSASDRDPSPDMYGYTTPMWLHAHRAWQSGGGLLWNDLQNCGQPFLGIVSSNVLYPPMWAVGWLDTPTALLAWTFMHLALAGFGAFWFARALGVGRIAACSAVIAVQLGGLLPFYAMWTPLVVATYAWFPVVLAAGERLLRSPSFGRATGFGIALTLQLAAGFPQIVVFECGVFGARVLWELATRRAWPWRRALLLLCFAVSLPPLLGAVHFLPSLEVLAESVRTFPMEAESINLESRRGPAFENIRALVDQRASSGGLLAIVMLLAGAALARPAQRRIASFYVLAGCFSLALVPDSPLRDLYQSVPGLDRLRGPERLASIASLCACLLVGHGIEALIDPARRARVLALIGAIAGALVFHLLAPSGLLARELALAASVLILALANWRWSRLGPFVAPLLALALFVDVWPAASASKLRLLPDDQETYSAREAFQFVAARSTPQDRVFVLPANRWLGGNMGLLDKTSSLFMVPSISDYEHLVSRRYATFYAYMTSGELLEEAGRWIIESANPPKRLQLFDMLAARYVVTDKGARPTGSRPAQLLWSEGRLRVFENPRALSRAYFVPEAKVIEAPERLLATLASRDHDPLRRVLLDRPPGDGFLGAPASSASSRARVTIESAGGETLELVVATREAGFLVVMDQHFPGWTAKVGAEPVEILRANHAFRAVRVPAGRSRVVFRYEPASLSLGASLSACTAAALLLVAGLMRVRHDTGLGSKTTRERRTTSNET